MSWQKGTSPNYKDLLTQVRQIATSNSLSSVMVSSGGTGYTVGDVLSLTGGTKTHTATLRVTAVSGGVITAVVINEGGAYTVNPANPVGVTGGTGTGATFTCTFASNGWTVRVESKEAVSATVAAGGSGYSVGNMLTVVGGLFQTTATFQVATIGGGGAVTSVTLVSGGEYDSIPSNPASTTGGAGTGATLNVTYQAATTAERTLLMEGTGSGPDHIFVGFRTFQLLSLNGIDTAFNWGLFSSTGFNAALRWYNQPGISPGFSAMDGSPDTTGGAFVPLKTTDAFAMDFWVSVTPRRIRLVALVRNASISNYSSLYLGFGNPYGTTNESPYPIFVAGSAARRDLHFTHNTYRFSGIVEVVGILNFVGPMFYRRNDSAWQSIRNSFFNESTTTRIQERNVTCYPAGRDDAAAPPVEDRIVINTSAMVDWEDVIPTTGLPGTETYRLKPTPKTGGDRRLLVPATVAITLSPDFDIVLELDGVFWVSGDGLGNQDTVTDPQGRKHRIFQNGSQSNVWSFMAHRED